MVYQSFPGEETGDSDSFQKLNQLFLPSLEGLTILDIGCSEGFFCFDALNRGAKRIVGIDKNKLTIEKATKRAKVLGLSQSAQFICLDWQELPDEKFDIIFLLSSLHYADDQLALIDKIMGRLSETGTFILECGIHEHPNNIFMKIRRDIDTRYFPSFSVLKNHLGKYAFRILGKSIKQKGDPVNRWVIHISHKKDFCVLISGPSISGKTTLARALKSSGMRIVSLDGILAIFVEENPGHWGNLDVSNCRIQLTSFYNVINKDHELCDNYIKKVTLQIKQERKTAKDKSPLFIEGFGLNLESISTKLIYYLENNGFILWNLTRPLSEQGEIESVTNELVQGWAFSNSLLQPQIEIFEGDKLMGSVETNIERNDIHKRFPSAPSKSGFLYKFHAKLNNKAISAKFKYQGGEIKLATPITKKSQNSNNFRNRLKNMLGFSK